ncbi:hypothetical protein HYU12_00590 [Candidatus Woesearchaeota archaeon]|nr:hypothetical protein [Candidatus Woesearchaeota archaeon]
MQILTVPSALETHVSPEQQLVASQSPPSATHEGAHACVLHDFKESPVQLVPPHDGTGLVQLLVCVPPPHGLLHDVHALQPPATELHDTGALQTPPTTKPPTSKESHFKPALHVLPEQHFCPEPPHSSLTGGVHDLDVIGLALSGAVHVESINVHVCFITPLAGHSLGNPEQLHAEAVHVTADFLQVLTVPSALETHVNPEQQLVASQSPPSLMHEGAHACVLHNFEGSPTQPEPPQEGTGLLQVLVCDPPPQDLLHDVHALQPPLTGLQQLPQSLWQLEHDSPASQTLFPQ